VAHILLVDDEPEVLVLFREILELQSHSVEEAVNVAQATDRLADAAFDLVVCDVGLRGESGLALVRRVADDLPDTAIIMVTAADEPALAEEALSMGACGYLVKPCRPNDLVISVSAGLRMRDLEHARRSHLDELESKVLHRTAALHDAVQRLEENTETAGIALRETADRLVTALTLRSEETGGHIQRMSRYGAHLALASGFDTWSEDEIRVGMMLHDVGKIGVPDAILLKPGPLTGEELEIIQRHPLLGAKLLGEGQSPILAMGAQIALSHHERWDGDGYPSRLAGESIPIVGRIAAIVDVFDALTSDRVYRSALPTERACEIMTSERARHFDPDLLDVFTKSIDDMLLIREAHPDLAPPPAPTAGMVAGRRAVGVARHLTAREMAVLRLMTEGLSNQSIAATLDLRLNTVRNHVQRTLNKLDAHSKLEAVAAARRRGLLPPG
jgi:putative two-component system response regulator